MYVVPGIDTFCLRDVNVLYPDIDYPVFVLDLNNNIGEKYCFEF